MNRYQGIVDPYLISGTGVLKNRLGLTNSSALEIAEARIASLRTMQTFPVGKFDRKHLLAHHAQLFSAIYVWAGKIRTVQISKGPYRFESPDRIARELDRIFVCLSAENALVGLTRTSFCERAAEYYSDINVVHPFREGNGRTQRRFFEQLALNAGFSLAWKNVPPHAMIEASIRGWERELLPMRRLFDQVTVAR